MIRLFSVIGFLATPPIAIAEWIGSFETDPFTDQTVAVASSSYSAGINTHSVVVRCEGEEFSTYVDFDDFLDDGMIDAKYRVDKLRPVATRWRPSADGTAVFTDTAVARGLVTGQSIVFEVLDYRGVPHRAKFDLTGAREKVLPVMKACGARTVPLAQGIDGLRDDFAQELEAFTALRVSLAKEMLVQRGEYDGPVDSELDSEFALAFQRSTDAFRDACKQKRLSDDECGLVGLYWTTGKDVPLKSMVYTMARGELKERAGKLTSFD